MTVQRQFREGRLIDRTKKNKIRVVDLSREVCEEFRAHRARMQREALAAEHPLSEFVFLTRLGEPIRSKSSFERRVFHRVVRLAGLTRRVTFQHLRQTFCSDVVASSGDLLYASEQAGHASVKVTGDYYSHYRPGQTDFRQSLLTSLMIPRSWRTRAGLWHYTATSPVGGGGEAVASGVTTEGGRTPAAAKASNALP